MSKSVTFCKKQGVDVTNVMSYIKANFNFIVDDFNPEVVICLGGDGTFLDAVSRYGCEPIYIPINLGTLGFYSSWGNNNLENLVDDVKKANILEAVMLEVELCAENICKKYYSLNEITIVNHVHTQILDVKINDLNLESFRGTGICVSTPTGSTAYNKSLGGAIISSHKKLYQLAHIATINNVKYRSVENAIILDETEELSFTGDFINSTMTIDRHNYKLAEIDYIKVHLSNKKVSILVPEDNNFYARVKKAFIE